LGKLIASTISILSIAFLALPAGVISSGLLKSFKIEGHQNAPTVERNSINPKKSLGLFWRTKIKDTRLP